MLKLAGVKTEAAFYKKYPTQEAFMKVHGKAFKKAQIGTYIGGEAAATPKPINFNDVYDQADLSITGKTNAMRQEEMYKQAALAADQKQAQGGGDMFSQIGGALGSLGTAFGEEAEYGAYIPKAQFGNMFKGFNPGNTQVPSGIGYSPMSTNLTSSGFQMPSAAKSFASNNPLPAGVPNVGNPQSGMMDKIGGAIGKYAGPAGQIIQGIGALKAQKNALKQAKQTRQVSDLALDASKTRPEESQRRYTRPEDMVTSGNQVGFTQGTGTNVLAQKGAKVTNKKQVETSIFDDISNTVKDVWDTVSGEKSARENKARWEKKKKIDADKEKYSTVTLKKGKNKTVDISDLKNDKSLLNDPANETSYRYNNPRATSFVDNVRPNDVIDVKRYSQPWLVTPVPTVNDKQYQKLVNKKIQGKGLSDLEKGRLAHIDWYSDPETIKKFAKNTGLSGKRLRDFIARSLQYNVKEGNPGADILGETTPENNTITMQKQSNPNDVSYGISKYWDRPTTMMHEYAHASELDSVLAPALYKALGKPDAPRINKNQYSPYIDDFTQYISKPEEIYGNFHGFRNKLKFKPGEKTTPAKLKKRFESWQKQNMHLDDNMIKGGYNFEQLANAINTIAYNPENDDNATYAKDGAEIQNTYAPGTLYDDLGYEPLNDSDEVKQYANGGFPWDIAGNIGSNIGGAIVGQDAGSQIGGTLGGTLGTALGGPLGGAIGKTLGTVAGGLLDTTDRDMRKQQSATDRNMQAMAFGQGAQSLQAQNSAVMEDGGYVSHDWTPQLITKFGDYDLKDLLAPDETMDTLRAGGHLRAYKEPSERAMQTFAMGGELQTHWGGHMEEMSQNPYLPDGGVTYMPHGQSHEESDGNGRTGIGITYGDNPVEVERREPIMKLRDGSTGEDNLVVFGNLEIPKYGVELLGDKKAKGMKFKNYVADLSKSETKQNKTIQKSAEKLADFDPIDSFDKLKFAGLQANILGGNMKLKEIAQTKEKAAALQNAINDTAEEMGVDADSLAKGRVKMAKMGGEFSKAQYGKSVDKRLDKYKTDFSDNAIKLKEVVIPAKKKGKFKKPVIEDIEMPEHLDNPYAKDDAMPLSEEALSYVPKVATTKSRVPRDYSWIEAVNSIIPTLRPSNAEELDGRQLYGEMYALSQNQEEPVQAQQFSPQLANAYSISLQDQMNEITAQTRAAQRMAQNNPAAQAAIAAQAYEAINKVKGEEFRMNQGLANQVQTANIAAMNDAQLKNLGILDQQYTRQAQARSNTKAVAQAALNSISDKYAKNSLENRTLQTYENMYNYRYDKAGRLINMNPLAQFNTPTVGSTSKPKDASGDDLLPVYNSKGDVTGYKVKQDAKTKEKAKNGSIVKAIRNL
jgi:hypothetical protein